MYSNNFLRSKICWSKWRNVLKACSKIESCLCCVWINTGKRGENIAQNFTLKSRNEVTDFVLCGYILRLSFTVKYLAALIRSALLTSYDSSKINSYFPVFSCINGALVRVLTLCSCMCLPVLSFLPHSWSLQPVSMEWQLNASVWTVKITIAIHGI